ncbi:hypothetical protein SCAR479_09240 [Seiridium cardinale]|uniref:Fungal N-terminal domain-containing protein n=1 Tax=Seiridium cardinale TaxID=138064 RepID=A0ABR2XK50_9PEZI
MEVVGAAASFIAIGQALAAIPKLVHTIQAVANTRQELEELLFELEIIGALYDEVETCFELIRSDDSLNNIVANEPAYIKRLRFELLGLLSQLQPLAKDCEVAVQQRLSKRIRAKWIWEKSKITGLCERARRIQGNLQSAMSILAIHASWQERRSQTKLLVEIHAVTTNHGVTRDAYSLPNKDVLWGASAAHSGFSSTLSGKGHDPCTCSCHTSPARVVSIRSFWPLSTTPCACLCRKGRYEMKYRFPKWLAQRALHVAAYVNGARISISLSIPIVVEWSAAWGIMAELPQNGAFEWLTRKRTSPMDIDIFGVSYLEYASDVARHTYNKRSERGAARGFQMRLDTYKNPTDRHIYISRLIVDLAGEEETTTMIHTAIRNGHGLEEALACQPTAINDWDMTGQTPLHLACILQRFDELQCLIEHGADMKKIDSQGGTPLHLAAMDHLEHFAEALLDAGCDIDHVDIYGRPALFNAIQFGDGDRFAMVTYLIQRGASLHVRDAHGSSVLHELSRYAKAASGIEQCFADLMDAGCSLVLEARNNSGTTPLLMAIFDQNTHMVRLLLQAGAQTDVTNNHGWNILHYTAIYGSYDIMQYLSQGKIANTDISAVNSDGWTPLEHLRYNMHHDLTDFPSWRSPSTEEIQAFEHLLRDMRDRMIHRECAELKQVLSAIQTGETDEARRMLRNFTDAKVTAKIDWEAETFRAIELDVRKGDVELAVQSIEEFIEASKARLEVSPFDEEDDPWLASDSESNVSDSVYETHEEDEEASCDEERETAFERKDGASDPGDGE